MKWKIHYIRKRRGGVDFIEVDFLVQVDFLDEKNFFAIRETKNQIYQTYRDRRSSDYKRKHYIYRNRIQIDNLQSEIYIIKKSKSYR